MNCFLIINPRSRNQQSRKRFRKILEEFRKTGMDFDHVFISSYAGIRAESEYANRKGYDAIIAVGGDGTINATINGFYDGKGNRISKAWFGVIYTGTSPDFCKSYGIPLKEKESIGTFTNPNIRCIRTGKITFRNATNSGITETRIFVCCANVGLGAGVAALSNNIRKYTCDFIGTLISLLWNLAVHGSRNLIVKADQVVYDIPRVMNISIGRTKFIASGIRVSDGVEDDDDRFYILTAKNISVKTLSRLLYQVYTGELNSSGDLGSSGILELTYARHLEFQSSGGPVGVEFDGDPAGFLPATIELAADPLDLMIQKSK